ncbi:MAG: hypothetical protein HOC23_12320 [Halieaceae bacterium]|nr:hypothetical protein [Halieaceae bacterium]
MLDHVSSPAAANGFSFQCGQEVQGLLIVVIPFNVFGYALLLYENFAPNCAQDLLVGVPINNRHL